jgi:hypothetical protein
MPSGTRVRQRPQSLSDDEAADCALDLLDANKTTWTFVTVERVGRVKGSLVRGLTALAARDH